MRTTRVLSRAMVLSAFIPATLVLGGSAAQASPASSTLRLHVVPESDFDTPDGYVAINRDVDLAGRRVGSDVTTCRAISNEPVRARCDVGLALQDGLLVLTFTESESSSAFSGRVLGGTGTYRGASGTLSGQERPDGAYVTIRLHRR